MAKCHFCEKILSDKEGSLITLNEKTGEVHLASRSNNPGTDPPSRNNEYINILVCENEVCGKKFAEILNPENKNISDILNSDNRQKSEEGQCYIATACYGDYNAPEVLVFRQFRDTYLLNNSFGISLVRFYYRHSPFWANKLKNHLLINKIIKMLFLDIIYKLLERIDYQLTLKQ